MTAAAPQPSHPGLGVLRHRDFRLLWLGQLVSTVGDQMQAIAIGWHVYQATNSSLALGTVALCRVAPFMVLSLLGGALADASDRKRLLVVTQWVQIAVTLLLVASTGLGDSAIWVIYLATFLAGAANAFDGPARQALIPNLVPPSDLAHALTLNTLLRQTASIVGPGLGGWTVAQFGLSATYAINAASFLGVVAAVLLRGPVPPLPPATTSNWQRIAEGLQFARTTPLVFFPMLLDFVTRCLGSPRGLLPVYARDVYAVGVQGLGWLSAAGSAGAVVGGLVLSRVPAVPRPLLLVMAAYFLEGALTLAFALEPGIGLAVAILFGLGVCNVIGEVVRMTISQLQTPNNLRGRTGALAGMIGASGPQLGQMEVGALAAATSPGVALAVSGAGSALLSLAIALVPAIRTKLLRPTIETL